MSIGNGNGNGEKPILPRRLADAMVVVAFVVTILVLAGVVVQVFVFTGQIQEINQRQAEFIKHQNELQLCTQHDMTIAIRKIGVKLGLPVEDIYVPDVKGFDCP